MVSYSNGAYSHVILDYRADDHRGTFVVSFLYINNGLVEFVENLCQSQVSVVLQHNTPHLIFFQDHHPL